MLVEQVRDLWQFSAICQFVFMFGEPLKIPAIDIEAFEQELALEEEDGPYLRDIRLSLIKSLSSNRTINIDNMDDFIRRQYTYRRIIPNPMLRVERVWKEHFNEEDQDSDDGSELGEVEEVEETTLISWLELSVPDRLDILHHLCEWQLVSEKFRERVGATTELQMSLWRIDSIGTDSRDRLYYFLDDGRLYRSTNPATTYDKSMKSKINNKKRKRSQDGDYSFTPLGHRAHKEQWTCIATNYTEWHKVIEELGKPSDSQEKRLLQYLRSDALPQIEEIERERRGREAALKAKAERAEAERIKEMLRLESLSTRKRSNRIAVLDEKREAERLRLEEAERQRLMEYRAHRIAEQEQLDLVLNVRKTREARARDRELRDYLDAGRTLISQSDKSQNLENVLTSDDTTHRIDSIRGTNGVTEPMGRLESISRAFDPEAIERADEMRIGVRPPVETESGLPHNSENPPTISRNDNIGDPGFSSLESRQSIAALNKQEQRGHSQAPDCPPVIAADMDHVPRHHVATAGELNTVPR